MKKIGLLFSLVVLAGLLLAGCASQATPSPTPLPNVVSTPTSEPTVEATSTPEPTVESTPVPEQTLEGLRDNVQKILEDSYGKPVSFSSDRDPASGLITYLAGTAETTYNYQVTVKKAVSKQWPPATNVVQMESEGGIMKNIIYSTLTSPSKIQTDAQIECGGFSFLIIISFEESYTGVNPTGDRGSTLTKMLMDACG